MFRFRRYSFNSSFRRLHSQLEGSGRQLMWIRNSEVSAIGVLYSGREETVRLVGQPEMSYSCAFAGR
jgi:hypothetical protein